LLPRSALATDALVDATVRNREGGFFTAAADPSVSARAVTGSLPREEVRALAALTDGATRWVERFGEGDWTDCLALIRKEGAQALVDRVRARERADTERVLLGRSKTHDDATVVFVELCGRAPERGRPVDSSVPWLSRPSSRASSVTSAGSQWARRPA